MKLWSPGFEDGKRIPEKYALGKHDPKSHSGFTDNLNPPLAWSDLPAGTKSLVLICHDSDVPSDPEDVNQEGLTVPEDQPRVDFFHWVLVDLAPEPASIAEGEFSRGVTPQGKPGPHGPRNTRQGLNDYTAWFEGDNSMRGTYFGYDGPYPPWNDSRLHHYHFTLYALDVERCPVGDSFTGMVVRDAIRGHVLGEAQVTGTYAINPDVKG